MKFIKSSTHDFMSLLKAIELDNEWHRTVTNASFKMTLTTRAPILKSLSGASKWPLNGVNKNDSGTHYPCPHCGTVMLSHTKHILNGCEAFQDRYFWRRANIVNYIDSILDHNQVKAFCDLPDRRTSAGGTIPIEIQPYAEDGTESSYTNLKPDLVVVDRRSNDVHIVVITIADDSEIAEVQKTVIEQYREMIDLMSVKAGSDAKVCFHTVEIGSYSGLVSETTKFALWEVYKLTTRTQSVNVFIDNVVSLAKLGSFKIFKSKGESRWDRYTPYLYPTDLAVKKKGLVKSYLISLGKFLGLTVALAACIFLLHIGYILSGWFWANLTFKIMIIIYITIMGLFLSLFRP